MEYPLRFKMWLRGPADAPRVEFIGAAGWYWQSGHFSQRPERSIMAELLTDDQVRMLRDSNGRWSLPGTPP
ncbi:hypothetical protein [Actinoplanes sp. NPDC051859]|uniref:hypothetical protein n=1 Tax=Actinoplanes sp. NPDC051859 TaxID=3363909 RepID=UPI0037B26A82